jgi:hypothetical protein
MTRWRFDRVVQAGTLGLLVLLALVVYADTPPRLVELECPICHTKHWEIDRDYTGLGWFGRRAKSYEERKYGCHKCGYQGSGYQVLQKSPPQFFLQPHPMHPMTQADFDRWVAILRENFPDHPQLKELGNSFRPNTVFPDSQDSEVP